MANLVDKINAKHIRKDVPEIRVGDTVRVDVRKNVFKHLKD